MIEPVVLKIAELSRLHGDTRLTASGLTRMHHAADPQTCYLLDHHESATCLFIRTQAPSLKLVLEENYTLQISPAGGWLLSPIADSLPTFWVPQLPMRRKLDSQGHILSEAQATILGIEAASNYLTLGIGHGEGSLDVVIWRFDTPLLVHELTVLSPLEQQAWFLWGSHTIYKRPADLYLHLIHGHVYENRTAWPYYWKICSENDAHALYVILSGLMRTTCKRIYGLLRTQVAISVIDRLGEDGAFRHGEWSKELEVHYRLHTSGLHLMMDHLAENGDQDVASALVRAAKFLMLHPDHIAFGAWFLHDELELNANSMKKSPFKWKASGVLGKSPSNMLVLNTHLDTLIALDRAQEFSKDLSNSTLLAAAAQSASKVLQLRPAETLYKIVSNILYLTFLPFSRAHTLPIHKRALKRIGWKWIAPRLHLLKTAFPRLVMPGGYVDRAISLQGVADDYQSINIMDMLRFLRRHPDTAVERITKEGLAFTHSSGILERWAELPQKEYALGFWAEALWHACTLYPDDKYRIWLAEAMILLESKQIGLPPSLLGANAEAIAPSDQYPCPIPAHPQIRIANICRCKTHEILVVNATDTAVELDWVEPPIKSLQWFDELGRKLTPYANIHARSWLLGRSE